MQVIWHELLKALQVKVQHEDPTALQCCPVHAGNASQPTLTVHKTQEPNDWHFICSDPHCRFNGNAIAMVCAVRKLDIRSAYQAFLPGGNLFHTVDTDTEFPGLELLDQDNQSELQVYFHRCQVQLHQQDTLASLRIRGNARNWLSDKQHNIPPAIGSMVLDNAPKALQRYCKASKRDNAYLVARYSFNNQITQFKLINLDNRQQLPTVVKLNQDIGIFMEEHITPDTKDLFVAGDELLACAIYQRYMLDTTKPPALVCLDTVALPDTCKNLEAIHFLLADDINTIPFETMCKYLAIFPGKIYVEEQHNWRQNSNVCDYYAHYIANKAPDHGRNTLQRWLIRHIKEALNANKRDTAENFIRQYLTCDKIRDRLIKYAETYDHPDVAELFRTIPLIKTNATKLANGRCFHTAPDGIRTGVATSTLTSTLLTNLHIGVLAKCLDDDGTIHYKLEIKTTTDNMTAVMYCTGAQLMHTKTFSNCIRKAFAKQGKAPYIAFYECAGYDWHDIINKLAECVTVQQQSYELGTNQQYIYFPNFSLDLNSKTIGAPTTLADNQNDAIDMYAGLQGELVIEYQQPIIQLLGSMQHQAIAGFTLGLLHWLHQVIIGSIVRHTRKRIMPCHLFYVEDTKGSWATVYSQLLQVFSGTQQIPYCRYKANQYHDVLRMLGNLPALGVIQAKTINAFQNTVETAPTSLISVIDTKTALSLNDQEYINFITHNDYTRQEITQLHQDDIATLRQILPTCILELHRTIATNQEELSTLTNSLLPGAELYSYLAKLLNVPLIQASAAMATCYYGGFGFANLDSFLLELHRLLMQPNTNGITISYDVPYPETLRSAAPPHIFILDGYVLAAKSLTGYVNKRSKFGNFNLQHIENELQSKRYCVVPDKQLNIDMSKYWAIDRRVWNTYVVREPLRLSLVTNTTAQPLQRIMSN